VIRLQAAEGDGPYSQLFSYLSVRNRCGVVSSWGSLVKDLYIIPLSANSAIPSALLPFSGPGKHSVHMRWLQLREGYGDPGQGNSHYAFLFYMMKIHRDDAF